MAGTEQRRRHLLRHPQRGDSCWLLHHRARCGRGDRLSLAGTRQASGAQGGSHRYVTVRPAGREGEQVDGPLRGLVRDPALSGGLPAGHGGWLVPGGGGQAQAVPSHRPERVHPLRGMRRYLPVEVHPLPLARRHRRGDQRRRPP